MSVKIVDVSANSVEEAFEQAGLDWIANQAEMINTANGKVIAGKKVIYRSDNNEQLGVVGKNYGVIDNINAFSFFNIICEKNKASICKVSEYGGGTTVHLEAEVRDKVFEPRVGDQVGFRFNLFNNFDGTKKTHVRFGCLRLVCSNGLVGFGNDISNIEIRHTKNAILRLEEAVKVWAGGEQWYMNFVEVSKKLTQKMVDKQMVKNFLDGLFGDSDSGVNNRKREKVVELFENGKGNKGQNAWELYNATTEYVDWHSRKNSDDMAIFANIGAGYELKNRAFELALTI